MKTGKFWKIGIVVLVALITVFSWSTNHYYRKYQRAQTSLDSNRRALVKVQTLNDSLRNEAARNCDEKIQMAIKNLTYETDTYKPAKPGFLR
jgi:hypothetical protein